MATIKTLKNLFADQIKKLNKPVSWNQVQKLTQGIVTNKDAETRLQQLNAIFEAHGIETINGEYVSFYWQYTQALYVNMGDSYIPTFIYDTRLKRIVVGDMAWFVQSRKISD